LWLNATGARGEIAARAGNCVRVWQDFYTHCIDLREDPIGQQIEKALDPDSSIPPYRRFASRNFWNLYSSNTTWGGWGSNPRPADYEKYGCVHHAR
jgi:hypothetical protein